MTPRLSQSPQRAGERDRYVSDLARRFDRRPARRPQRRFLAPAKLATFAPFLRQRGHVLKFDCRPESPSLYFVTFGSSSARISNPK